MTNALIEFKETLDESNLLCVHIIAYADEETEKEVGLRVGYTETDLEMFYKQLDLVYESGYWGDQIRGTIWLKDDAWYERDQDQVDGSWSWMRRTCPTIPANCFH